MVSWLTDQVETLAWPRGNTLVSANRWRYGELLDQRLKLAPAETTQHEGSSSSLINAGPKRSSLKGGL